MKKMFSWLSVLVLAVLVFPAGAQAEKKSFRQVKVSPPQVEYGIEGEARVFEGTYHYRVKDGEKTITQGWGTASVGAPEWGKFKQTIQLPKSKSALKSDLKLELFETSAKDGSEVHKLVLPLKAGSYDQENTAFRNVQIHEPQVKYRVRGEARVSKGTYHYAVSDGHDYLAKGWGAASKRAPEWGVFQKTVQIPLKKMPVNGTLIMELSELSMGSDQQTSPSFVVMDRTPWK